MGTRHGCWIEWPHHMVPCLFIGKWPSWMKQVQLQLQFAAVERESWDVNSSPSISQLVMKDNRVKDFGESEKIRLFSPSKGVHCVHPCSEERIGYCFRCLLHSNNSTWMRGQNACERRWWWWWWMLPRPIIICLSTCEWEWACVFVWMCDGRMGDVNICVCLGLCLFLSCMKNMCPQLKWFAMNANGSCASAADGLTVSRTTR